MTLRRKISAVPLNLHIKCHFGLIAKPFALTRLIVRSYCASPLPLRNDVAFLNLILSAHTCRRLSVKTSFCRFLHCVFMGLLYTIDCVLSIVFTKKQKRTFEKQIFKVRCYFILFPLLCVQALRAFYILSYNR